MNTYTHLTAANAADDDYFVTATRMKVGAYTLAAAAPTTPGARRITITHTSAYDTYEAVDVELGTIVLVGKSLSGQTITETITPIADDIATSVRWFKSLTSVTGVGWEGWGEPDQVEVGYTEDIAVLEGPGFLHGVVVNTTAAGTVTLADAAGTIAILKASVAEGSFTYEAGISGYLTVDLGAASDVTVIHSQSVPTEYAMS